LVEGKQENEEKIVNSYSAHVKKRGENKKFKGPRKIVGRLIYIK